MSDDFLILIPCFNCYKSLNTLLIECLDITNNILLIDDGSNVIYNKRIKNEGINFIRLPQNHGVGYVLNLGLRLAKEKGFKYVTTIDSDGQHEPKFILPMIEFHKEKENQLTIGNRWANINFLDNFSSSKYFSNKFASQLMEITSGKYLQDVACGFRIISTDSYLGAENSKGYGFLYDIVIDYVQRALRISNFPISRIYFQKEPLITRIEEFTHMLIAFSNVIVDTANKQNINHLISYINCFEEIIVNIQSNNNEIKYYLFPIRKYDGYIFQADIIRNLKKEVKPSISVKKM